MTATRVEEVMGTVVSVDVRDPLDDAAAGVLTAFFEVLHEVDRRFSPYRADSEVSALGRGDIDAAHASRELTEVLGLCEEVRRLSAGAFDVWHHRGDGGFDPSGLVKGWAVERATRVLLEAGWRNLCVNAGGDVLTRGQAAPGRPWRIGVRHPLRAEQVAAVVLLGDGALATSGLYERGEHIGDPTGGGRMGELASLTVVGPSLTLADAYATAAFVMGRTGVRWVESQPGFGAFAATADGRAVWGPTFDAVLARGPADGPR